MCMNIEILQNEKDFCELKIDNITVAEILRVYLNEQGIKFAAWRREHPSKPIIFRIETDKGTVKKAVNEAVSAVKKDLNGLLKDLK